MNRASVAIFLAFACAPAGNAACSATSGAQRAHLVELYTSEGCDSCPPAERWMSSLGRRAGLVGLEFHVDYWDTVDWHDPFSSHAWTQRQQALADRGSKGQIYTPQIWVDGNLWHDWPKGAPPAPAEGPGPALRASAAPAADGIEVDLDGGDGTANADYRMYAAIAEDGLSEYVRGGENHGKTLAHDSVVRAFAGPLELPHAHAILELSGKVERANTALVAFIEDARSGTVVQTLKMPLGECKP